MQTREASLGIQSVTHALILASCHERRTIPITPHRPSRSERIAALTRARSSGNFRKLRPFRRTNFFNGASDGFTKRKVTESSSTRSSTNTSPAEKRSGKTHRLRESSFLASAMVGISHTNNFSSRGALPPFPLREIQTATPPLHSNSSTVTSRNSTFITRPGWTCNPIGPFSTAVSDS